MQEADFSRSLLEKKQEELHQMEENLHGREMVSQTLPALVTFDIQLAVVCICTKMLLSLDGMQVEFKNIE